MIKKFKFGLLLFILSFAASYFAFGQDILIDDFTKGGSPILAYQSGVHENHYSGDPAHLIGGDRDFVVKADLNALNQISTFQFRPDPSPAGLSAYIHNAAFYSSPRTEICYGCGGTRLHLDLSSYRDDPNGVVRFRFKGLSEVLNLNILLFTGGRYAAAGCNILAYPGEFVFDVPFSKFVNYGADFADITSMTFITQNGSPIGAVEFGLSSITISNTPYGGAFQCHA